MRTETRSILNAYLTGVAQDNSVDFSGIQAGQKFAIAPSVQQRLEKAVQESSEFLRMINIIGVTEQQGEVLGLGIAGTIAGTTDTTAKDRETQDIHKLTAIAYHCQQINYCSETVF